MARTTDAATGARSSAKRPPWDRFSEAVLASPQWQRDNPLDMPVEHIYFELLLEASISTEIADRHFQDVMARMTSTDFDIGAADHARHAAHITLSVCWAEFKERRRRIAPRLQQVPE